MQEPSTAGALGLSIGFDEHARCQNILTCIHVHYGNRHSSAARVQRNRSWYSPRLVSCGTSEISGAQRPSQHNDLAFWFQGPRRGGFQKSSSYTVYHVPYAVYHILYIIYDILDTILNIIYYSILYIYQLYTIYIYIYII